MVPGKEQDAPDLFRTDTAAPEQFRFGGAATESPLKRRKVLPIVETTPVKEQSGVLSSQNTPSLKLSRGIQGAAGTPSRSTRMTGSSGALSGRKRRTATKLTSPTRCTSRTAGRCSTAGWGSLCQSKGESRSSTIGLLQTAKPAKLTDIAPSSTSVSQPTSTV